MYKVGAPGFAGPSCFHAHVYNNPFHIDKAGQRYNRELITFTRNLSPSTDMTHLCKHWEHSQTEYTR